MRDVKLNGNEIHINVDEAFANGIIQEYNKGIKNKLLAGESVNIEGVGTLRLGYRKVRNSYGRDFALRVKFEKDQEFDKELSEEYNKNKEKFIHLR